MPSYNDPNVQIGYWNFDAVTGMGTYKIPWDYPYPANEGKTPFGLDDMDLSAANLTRTAYLEWERDPEQMNHIAYVKIGNEWKEGILHIKTADGWKMVQNVHQKQFDGTWK